MYLTYYLRNFSGVKAEQTEYKLIIPLFIQTADSLAAS